MSTHKKTKRRDISRFFDPKRGGWNVDAMSPEDLDELARQAEEDCAKGRSRPLNREERKWFERWQRRALAEETKKGEPVVMHLECPPKLRRQIEMAAEQEGLAPYELVRKIVEEGVRRIVA